MSRSTATALPFGLTEEQQTISAMVRDFADTEIAPHALEWDQQHHFPVDVIKRSADLGMGGATGTVADDGDQHVPFVRVDDPATSMVLAGCVRALVRRPPRDGQDQSPRAAVAQTSAHPVGAASGTV